MRRAHVRILVDVRGDEKTTSSGLEGVDVDFIETEEGVICGSVSPRLIEKIRVVS